MPSSDPSNITDIVNIVTKIKPTTILDIGVGTGKYGLLFRDYLDGHWAGHAFHNPKTWTLKLIGIEIFPLYITPVHNYVYDDVWIGDAIEILSKCPAQNCFDLVFMGDFIEHLQKEQGKELIRVIKKNWLCLGGSILISTPNFKTILNDNRRAIFGNEHEIHKCQWYPQEFKEFGMNCEFIEEKLLTVWMHQ